MLLQNIEIQGQKDKLNLERKHCLAPCFDSVQILVKKNKNPVCLHVFFC